MRFIITAQAATDKEAAERHAQPGFDAALFRACMRFNEAMQQAGALAASAGRKPWAPRARIALADGKRHVGDGFFAGSKEIVGA